MDVDGTDAAQKLVILSQLAFGTRVALEDFPNVKRWYDEISLRPAVEKGMAVPFYND
jgi:glutathione S-transferase